MYTTIVLLQMLQLCYTLKEVVVIARSLVYELSRELLPSAVPIILLLLLTCVIM